ncbi:hypothetical protein B0A48_06072 [Cryoendolithus antarcticus]|uniref:Uncharacterized protein n=1 Tax=Cryoendolithus antarcticus TaxID=1507870 RepID=A0A1V8TD60_9PEZI|nr:hypothetical protein B0A48_06072 [Cryoendolithus antarcticus]
MSYDSSDDSNSDTIHVASALVLDGSDNENPLRVDEQLERGQMRRVHAEAEKASYNGRGKGRVSTSQATSDDSVMSEEITEATSDSGSDVEEYTFTAEDDADELLAVMEIEDFVEDETEVDDDARSHISVSSDIEDDGKVELYHLDTHPWRGMSRAERLMFESQFGQTFEQPLKESWNVTEDHHRVLDEMMFRYAAEVPFAYWVSDKITVQEWVMRQYQRQTWRQNFGRVYNRPTRPLQQQQQYPQLPYPGAQHQGASHPSQHRRSTALPLHKVSMPPGSHSFLGHGQYNVHHMHGLNAILGTSQPQRMPYPSVANQGDLPYLPRQPYSDLSMGSYSYGNLRSSPPRNKKSSPALPPPTPPYAIRPRPVNIKAPPKTSRGTKRRQAEADDFPWNRDFDFIKAKIAAQSSKAWDMSIYDASTLKAMEAVRASNMPIFEGLEDTITNKQKTGRLAKKAKEVSSDPVSEDESPAPRQKGGRRKTADTGNSSPAPDNSALVGNFAFESDTDRAKALSLSSKMTKPEDLIIAGEDMTISLDVLATIKIFWSPGNKGPSQNLHHAVFSVTDAILTHQQLAGTKILNETAAKCIIDFRPDLLWRETLIRILSEGNMSNKEIRDRVCLNGCNSDRATITKRLGAALGNNSSTVKDNYEAEVKYVRWANGNRRDYKDYQSFFGKHPPPVRELVYPKIPEGTVVQLSSDVDPEAEVGRPRKQLKLTTKGLKWKASELSSSVVTSATEEKDVGMVAMGTQVEEEVEQEAGAEDDEDAVSLQGSDVLDEMSD